jgi:hypothetical protein
LRLRFVVVKALDLVRKVSAFRTSLRRREGREGHHDLRRRAAVSALRVTTALARQMQRVPMPRPSAAERGALAMAAAPLRAMVDQELLATVAADKDSPEAALVELVQETLALVDKLLEGDAELPRERPPRGELPVPSTDPTRQKVSL